MNTIDRPTSASIAAAKAAQQAEREQFTRDTGCGLDDDGHIIGADPWEDLLQILHAGVEHTWAPAWALADVSGQES